MEQIYVEQSTSNYLSTAGKEINFQGQLEEIKAEYALQRFRDIWVATQTYPYLAIDALKLQSYIEKLGDFVVFTAGTLFQNIQRADLQVRLLNSLIGQGLTANASPSSGYLVEGEANPQSHILFRFNGLLMRGCSAFAATHTHYLAVEQGRTFQRKFAELKVSDSRSRPQSEHFDFAPLVKLSDEFHTAHLNAKTDPPNLSELNSYLDQIFIQNERALNAAEKHHANARSEGPRFNYTAPALTKYGRLVHNTDAQPAVEIAYALLHYEMAIRQFDALKEASMKPNQEEAFASGVYCVVAIAACIEAIANRLMFDAKGVHPGTGDTNDALSKINHAGRVLTTGKGSPFQSLGKRDPMYVSLDKVRQLRNSFMHAKEQGTDIDSITLTSVAMSQVSVGECRTFLTHLRMAVDYVFNQLPGQARPISTNQKVRWAGELEVP